MFDEVASARIDFQYESIDVGLIDRSSCRTIIMIALQQVINYQSSLSRRWRSITLEIIHRQVPFHVTDNTVELNWLEILHIPTPALFLSSPRADDEYSFVRSCSPLHLVPDSLFPTNYHRCCTEQRNSPKLLHYEGWSWVGKYSFGSSLVNSIVSF